MRADLHPSPGISRDAALQQQRDQEAVAALLLNTPTRTAEMSGREQLQQIRRTADGLARPPIEAEDGVRCAELLRDLCDVLLESWAGGGAVGSEPVEQDVRPELHEPATVPPSECNDYDLVELVGQLHTRSFLHNENRDLHEAWVEARNELLRRLGERLGRLPAPTALNPSSPERGLRNSDQPFYLIELPHHCNHDDRPRWMRLGAWADDSGDSWTDDVHEATPWPTRSAADVYRERGGFGIDLSNAVVTEHAWLSSTPSPERAMGLEQFEAALERGAAADGKAEAESDIVNETREYLINQIMCRLPKEILDKPWEHYYEEHVRDWINKDRAFGGWLSQRIQSAFERLAKFDRLAERAHAYVWGNVQDGDLEDQAIWAELAALSRSAPIHPTTPAAEDSDQ